MWLAGEWAPRGLALVGLLFGLFVSGASGQQEFGPSDVRQLLNRFSTQGGGGFPLGGFIPDYVGNNPWQAPRQACVPFRPPAGFDSLQDYCKYLRTLNDSVFEQQYSAARGPAPDERFPLNGCVLGCVLGKDSHATAMRFGSGVWSGKCFSNYDQRSQHADVVNLLSPLPPGVSVVDAFDWGGFFPSFQQFQGDLSIGPSWDDAYTTRLRRVGPSWAILYDDVQPQQLPGDLGSTGLQAMSDFYANLVRQTRDEMRQVAPGMLLGRMYARPQTGLNPLPFPVDQRIKFALFQVCSRRSPAGFATSGGDRDFSPPKSQ